MSLFIFLSIFCFSQKPSFNIRYSEPLAVFVFVENLSSKYPDNPFKTEFNKSNYNNEKYKKLISEFDSLQLEYSYEYTDFPYGSKTPGMTKHLLKKNLILADNLSDFKTRSVGIITNQTLSQLSLILSEFTLVYNTIIYNPNKEKFDKKVKDISEYTSTKNIKEYFETGVTFYNSIWDYTIPFEIAFYPLPNAQWFTAESFFNNEISAIQTNLEDYNVLLSVMLHEIFHSLYDEQSLQIKKEIDSYFKNNPSKYSNYANLLLNEVLATALGNGYVYENLSNGIDTGEWYNYKYINLMAKQIYPTLKQYIINKKTIDKLFIDSYIKQYEQTYPNWLNELDHTMAYRYILSDNKNDFNTIRFLYNYCSYSNSEDEITEESIDRMKESPITKIIVVSKKHKSKLALIRKKFPELKNWNYQETKDFGEKFFLNDKTHLYIINQYKTSLDVLFKNLEGQKN